MAPFYDGICQVRGPGAVECAPAQAVMEDLNGLTDISSRIAGVVVAHIYPCIGILTHDFPALWESAVEYFPSFW